MFPPRRSVADLGVCMGIGALFCIIGLTRVDFQFSAKSSAADFLVQQESGLLLRLAHDSGPPLTLLHSAIHERHRSGEIFFDIPATPRRCGPQCALHPLLFLEENGHNKVIGPIFNQMEIGDADVPRMQL